MLGLYFKISIALFILFILISIKVYLPKKFHRYLKLFIPTSLVIVFITSSFISCGYITYLNNKYEKIYANNEQLIKGTGIIISYKEDEYYNVYTIDTKKIKNIDNCNLKLLLYIKDKRLKFDYGDCVNFSGEYIKPNVQRNYRGFDYSNYLKANRTGGLIKVESLSLVSKNKGNLILTLAYKTKQNIIQKINKMNYITEKGLLKGILLGDTSNISDRINEDFKNSSLSHILAISGDHISYLILGIAFILNTIRFKKQKIYLITILFLIFFMFVVGFSPSVVRACIMGSILLGAKIFHRKQDFWISISLSFLIIVIYNPYSIFNVGLLLSYGGTIGIIAFSRNSINYIKAHIKTENKIIKFIYRSFAISLSVQLILMPIMMLNYNTFSCTFFISNIIAIPIIAIIILLGFLTVFISYILIPISTPLSIVLNLFLELLINVAKYSSKIPLSNVTITTPNLYIVFFYYIAIFLLNWFINLNKKTVKQLRNIEKIHLKILKKLNLKACIFIIIVIICSNIIIKNITKNDLDIYFIDVGQRGFDFNSCRK